MANHKSSIKRIKQSAKLRVFNKYYAKTMRNSVKALRDLNEKEEAAAMYPKVVSLIDRVAKKNIIHKNKASNLKSSLAAHVNAL